MNATVQADLPDWASTSWAATWLRARGWRQIGRRRQVAGYINYWDHPQHQHRRHGMFTTQQAVSHQQAYEKTKACDCVRETI